MEEVPSPKSQLQLVGPLEDASVKLAASPAVVNENADVGMSVTEIVSELPDPFPQTLTGVTVMLPPDVPDVADMTLVELVPVHPEGKLQMYDVAPAIGAIEHVIVAPTQGCTLLHAITPAALGISLTVTPKVLTEPVPQPLYAATLISPAFAPTTTEIEFVVLDPVHPEGKVQV